MPYSLLLALAVQTGAAAAATPPLPPAPCASAVYREFEFWVGDWDVYPNIADPAKAPLIAHSKIEKLYGGCAIRENWMPIKGTGGGSLNAPDPVTGRWHQYWLDGSGGRVEFDGGVTSTGAMVLTEFWRGVNGPGKDGVIRMTYTPQGDGSVRQHGEVSADHGLSWSTSFDFVYRRAKPAG